MYPIPIDPNRPDNMPTQHTLQVHMHHLCCPCNGVMYPYYPSSYRPPILAQPQPIARPSYLHHYQYTQLHVNPSYNVPLQPSVNQHLSQTLNQSSPSTVDLAFGPPPRERRNLDGSDYEEQRQIGSKSKNDVRDSLLQYTSLSTVDEAYCNTASAQNSYEGFVDLNATQVANMPTDSYITYLVNGCVTGEKIAKRNEHRPCFKNIQNLCNRTRSEVVKPNITVSNIHSQGMPWATKDFIFAFVRAINCWCILRGYLGSKDGNLGKIDREISPEFGTCYNKWEKCTKQLTYYLIDTFCKLDEANSPSNINLSNFQVLNNFDGMSASATIPLPPPTKANSQHESPRETATFSPTVTQSTQTINKSFVTNEITTVKGIPGILHIPFDSSAELDIPTQLLESPEASQPEDDSESESRIYMKPGSYNIPKKRSTTPRSIEFLDTVQNIEGHKKNVYETQDLMQSYDFLRDQMWQTAKSVTPNFIKQNEESPVNSEKEYDFSVVPFQNKKIEKWLNNEKNKFSSSDPFNNLLQIENSLHASTSCDGLNINKPVTVLKRSKYASPESNGDLSLKKRGELDDIRIYRRQPLFTRTASSTWDCKKGKLTEFTIKTLDKVFTDLERTDFAGHVTKKLAFNAWTDTEINNPTNLNTVAEKLKRSSYTYLSEFVHDIRHIMSNPNAQCADRKYLKHLAMFKNKFDELLEQEFPNLDFKNVTGDSKELFGLFALKQGDSKKADGDGDH